MKVLLSLLFLVLPLSAAAADTARELLRGGQYEQARDAGVATDTVEGLNIAAEAMAAEIMLMRVENARRHAGRAMDLTETVLQRDPGNTEALFLRALHRGFRTRSSSSVRILMSGLIGKTREAIETFEAAAPNDPRADALYGAWHLGIVRGAGDGRFGASLSEGVARYDAAVAAMPEDIVVMSNYAFSLIVMEDPDLLPRAKTLLQQIEATDPKDATEGDTRERMLRLLIVIDDPDALRQAARGLLNTEEVDG